MSLFTFTAQDADRNEKLNALDVLFATPFIIIVTQFAPVLITRLGATPLLIGAFTSGAALINAIMAALGARWTARVPDYRRAMAITGFIWRCVMFVIVGALLLPKFQAEAIVLGTMILSMAAGLTNYTLTAHFPRMTFADRLSRLISVRWVFLGAGMAIGTPLLAWLLDSIALPYNYIIACAISFVMVCVSLLALLSVKIIPKQFTEEHTTQSISISQLRKTPKAFEYLLVAFGLHFSINAAGPLITLQLVRGLGATDAQLGWFYALFWATVAILATVTPRIIRQIGNLGAFAFTGVVFGIYALLMALAANFQITLIGAVISGLAVVLFQVSAYGLMVECAPENRYEAFNGWNTIIINAAVFSAPLIMSSLVDLGMSVITGLIICAAIRIAAGIAAYVVLQRRVNNVAASS